jgi:hypothetical protein
VAATPATIAAGVLAGVKSGPGGLTFTEDAGLLDKTATTAYPLTWLNWLHAPATGLTVEKTNAIATLVRYVVTDGAAAHLPLGEASLPKVLSDEALVRADALVTSNCVGVDRKVVTRAGPGPFAPNGKLTGVASMKWCEAVAVAPPTTSTTIAPTTTVRTTTTRAPAITTSSSSSSTTTTTTTEVPVEVAGRTVTNNSGGSSSTPRTATTLAPTTTVPPAAATTTTAAPTTTTPAVSNLAPQTDPAELPFGEPQPSTPAFDRLTTMFVGGGGLFGAVRRWMRSGLR